MWKELIAKLQARMREISARVDEISAALKAEDRLPTEAEDTELDTLTTEFEAKEAELEKAQAREDAQLRMTASAGRRAGASNPGAMPIGSHDVDVQASDTERKNWGFKSFAEFALNVKAAQDKPGQMDQRLIANAAQSDVGTEGGFNVPPGFGTDIMTQVEEDPMGLLAKTDQNPTSTNNKEVAYDDTTPWGTAGIQAYWEGEGTQLTESKPAIKKRMEKLNKLTALVYVTEEDLEDAPFLDNHLRNKTPQVFTEKINLAIVQGTGVGQPLGFLSHASSVTVAKEGSQTADTITSPNIHKMFSRVYAPSWPRAEWLIHQDILPQLFGMTIEGTSSSVPAYLPPNGLSEAPFGTLMGRPVTPIQAANTLGDLGDIMLVDLSKYMTLTKVGGIQTATSIHLKFDYDQTAFRFIMRIAGGPSFSQPITPRSGSNTLSPFVLLAARA